MKTLQLAKLHVPVVIFPDKMIFGQLDSALKYCSSGGSQQGKGRT